MTGDRHKHSPVRFRPPEAEREWLEKRQAETGEPMNAILTAAVRSLIAAGEQVGVLDLLRAADAWITYLENWLTRLGEEVGDGPDLEGFLREHDDTQSKENGR